MVLLGSLATRSPPTAPRYPIQLPVQGDTLPGAARRRARHMQRLAQQSCRTAFRSNGPTSPISRDPGQHWPHPDLCAVVYLVLAAQYGSWLLLFSVIRFQLCLQPRLGVRLMGNDQHLTNGFFCWAVGSRQRTLS